MKLSLTMAFLLVGAGLHADLLDGIRFFDVELGEPVEMGPVSADSVLGMELLYATPGAGDVSEIAGHLLLRIRLDNHPRAREEGFVNPGDLVVSFLADTDSGQKEKAPAPLHVVEDCRRSNWFNLIERPPSNESPLASVWQSLKGLSGGFRVVMDRQTLGHALKSYTIEQDRDLLRYRLNFDRAQTASLLKHLEWVRIHHQPRYYFFSQNCGSFLIQVLGEGIGDAMLNSFHPWVSPPHTLVGNLVRRGLAVREVPGFYSYRLRALIARDVFREQYDDLVTRYPECIWPRRSLFLHRDETVRAHALAGLWLAAQECADLRPEIYRFAQLAQETDMLHHHKDWICENYTSSAATQARCIQKEILSSDPSWTPPELDVLHLLQDLHAPLELRDAEMGSSHTGLYPLEAGIGYFQEDDSKESAVTVLRAAFLEQQMGDPSAVAMQRQSSLLLGGVEVVTADDLKEWRLTGLRLQKFRDTRLSVPSVFNSTRGLGVGLTVLDAHHQRTRHRTTLNVLGGAILANLAASQFYDDYLFVSVGADALYTEQDRHRNASVRLPLRVQSLLTFGPQRTFQWRNRAGLAWSAREENSDEISLSSELAYRLGEWKGAEWGLILGLAYDRETASGLIKDDQKTLRVDCRMRVNRW